MPHPPAPLVIKLSAQKQTTDKAVLDLGKISFPLAACTYIFIHLIRLSYDSGTETVRGPRAKAAGEQEDYYDPLFTYKEGDEASYFVVSEDSRGDAANIGPSGAGTSKGSPMAFSSIGWTNEGSTSEGELAVHLDSAKNFPMELEGIDAAVERVRREAAAKAVEAVSPLGNTLIFCEQFSPDIHYALLK